MLNAAPKVASPEVKTRLLRLGAGAEEVRAQLLVSIVTAWYSRRGELMFCFYFQ